MKFPKIFFQSALFLPERKYHKVPITKEYSEISVSPCLPNFRLFSKGSELFQGDLRLFAILAFYTKYKESSFGDIDEIMEFGGKVRNVKMRRSFINSMHRLNSTKVRVEENGIITLDASPISCLTILNKKIMSYRMCNFSKLSCVDFPLDYFQNATGRVLMKFFWNTYRLSRQKNKISDEEIFWLVKLAARENFE